MKKINSEKVRRNKPKITKISTGKNRKSRNSCIVKVRGADVEGMMMLQNVGALVRKLRTGLHAYAVATVSRIDNISGLFCRRASVL